MNSHHYFLTSSWIIQNIRTKQSSVTININSKTWLKMQIMLELVKNKNGWFFYMLPKTSFFFFLTFFKPWSTISSNSLTEWEYYLKSNFSSYYSWNCWKFLFLFHRHYWILTCVLYNWYFMLFSKGPHYFIYLVKFFSKLKVVYFSILMDHCCRCCCCC